MQFLGDARALGQALLEAQIERCATRIRRRRYTPQPASAAPASDQRAEPRRLPERRLDLEARSPPRRRSTGRRRSTPCTRNRYEPGAEVGVDGLTRRDRLRSSPDRSRPVDSGTSRARAPPRLRPAYESVTRWGRRTDRAARRADRASSPSADTSSICASAPASSGASTRAGSTTDKSAIHRQPDAPARIGDDAAMPLDAFDADQAVGRAVLAQIGLAKAAQSEAGSRSTRSTRSAVGNPESSRRDPRRARGPTRAGWQARRARGAATRPPWNTASPAAVPAQTSPGRSSSSTLTSFDGRPSSVAVAPPPAA